MKKDKKNILILGDTQYPFDRKDYLPFCKAVAEKYGCGRVINIGDVADCLNFSDYARVPDMPSPEEEVKMLKKSFAQWEKAFPVVECLIGNHDRRIRRRLDNAGFSEAMLSLKDIFRRVFGLPKKWTLHDKIKLNTTSGPVYCLHGDERGASAIAGKTAANFGASTVTGHRHSSAFIAYRSTPHSLIFDMTVGCGIDDKSVAFRYNKKDIKRPIYSCGVILDGVPVLVPMRLDKNGRWTGRV